MLAAVRSLAERIRTSESRRERLAGFLREIAPSIRLLEPIAAGVAPASVVAVDGGLSRKALHGFDCLLARAVAVRFRYENGAAVAVEHWPSRQPAPQPFVAEAYAEQDWNCYTALVRQRLEAETATAAVQRFTPTLLLMDGLLFPHPADRPPAGSEVSAEYERAVRAWSALQAAAAAAGTVLAGVVEDSRSTRFCEHVRDRVLGGVSHPRVAEAQELLTRSRDTSLLALVMERGQRTLLFSPEAQLPQAQLRSFYLKTAQWDRPLRVDFYPAEGEAEAQADRLAAWLLAVSGQHAGYGMPAPLIEADSAARLTDHEMDVFYAQLLASAGPLPSLLQLRRDERPF